jgi:colicin import membrane protein
MSRLQTKCVAASAGVHALLLAMLVVGSAFVKPPPPPENIRKIRLFDASKITDDETQGGGNPNVPSDVQPTPPPAQMIQQPTPQLAPEPPIKLPEPSKPKPEVKKKKQPEPTPEPVKKTEAKKPDPVKPEPQKVVKRPEATKVVPKTKLTEKPPEVTKPEKPKIEVNLADVKKASDDPDAQRRKKERERAAKEAKEREEAEKRAAIRAQMEAVEQANREIKQRQAALGTIVGNIENKMSAGTVVEMPGPGGEAFINYADLIWTKYYQAWQRPEDHEVRSPVKVEIVVNRNGHVVSANIIKPSGDASLDRSVRQALDRVRDLPSFPEGAKDPQRTFTINFYLKSKRSLG